MSKKFDLISNIDKDVNKDVKKYQIFEAVLGFEKVVISIPLESSDDFEKEANSKKPKSSTGLIKIAKSFGGDEYK